MTADTKKIRDGEFEWWYPTAAAGESEVRRGIVIRDHEADGWWATCYEKLPKGRGRTKRAAIADAEKQVYGYTVSV